MARSSLRHLEDVRHADLVAAGARGGVEAAGGGDQHGLAVELVVLEQPAREVVGVLDAGHLDDHVERPARPLEHDARVAR